VEWAHVLWDRFVPCEQDVKTCDPHKARNLLIG
jgi:hypothetical protein